MTAFWKAVKFFLSAALCSFIPPKTHQGYKTAANFKESNEGKTASLITWSRIFSGVAQLKSQCIMYYVGLSWLLLYYVSIYVMNICFIFCINFMHCEASLGVLKGILNKMYYYYYYYKNTESVRSTSVPPLPVFTPACVLFIYFYFYFFNFIFYYCYCLKANLQ